MYGGRALTKGAIDEGRSDESSGVAEQGWYRTHEEHDGITKKQQCMGPLCLYDPHGKRDADEDE